MIKACMIILSCYVNVGFHEPGEKFACAVNAHQVQAVELALSKRYHYLHLTGRKGSSLIVAETPSQVLEKVNNCK